MALAFTQSKLPNPQLWTEGKTLEVELDRQGYAPITYALAVSPSVFR